METTELPHLVRCKTSGHVVNCVASVARSGKLGSDLPTLAQHVGNSNATRLHSKPLREAH